MFQVFVVSHVYQLRTVKLWVNGEGKCRTWTWTWPAWDTRRAHVCVSHPTLPRGLRRVDVAGRGEVHDRRKRDDVVVSAFTSAARVLI